MSVAGLPTLELRVPISPNDRYMRMMRYFMESLRLFGGPIARNARCVVSVGADEEPRNLANEYPWVRDFPIEFHWLDRELFRRDTFDATGYHRFGIESDADVVALVDADLFFAGDFDRLVTGVLERDVVAGFIAHVSPFFWRRDPARNTASSAAMWQRLFDAARLPPPRLEYQHPAWGVLYDDTDHRYSPAYFNYGVILGPRQLIERMGRCYVDELRFVESVIDSPYKSQIANTLAFARQGIACESMSINFNFPLNLPDARMRALNPDPDGEDTPEHIRIFHYLASGEINKRHFDTEASLRELLLRSDLSPSGAMMQSKLKQVFARIEGRTVEAARPHDAAPAARPPSVYLVCGGRRTGTTLLNAILCSDERANMLGQEAQILTRIVEAYRFGRSGFEKFGSSFFEDRKSLDRFFRDTVARFSEQVAARMSPGGVLVMKNPEFALVLNEINKLFPHACLLATVRDPRDEIASEIEVEARRLSDRGMDPAGVERDIASLADRYTRYYRQILRLLERQPERVNIVRFEDLVGHPEQTLQRLAAITGLTFTFDPGKPWPRVSPLAGLDLTPSRSPRYNRPLDATVIGRFRSDLSSDEIRTIETRCADIMRRFGYEPA